jgi:hypothetical protein
MAPVRAVCTRRGQQDRAAHESLGTDGLERSSDEPKGSGRRVFQWICTNGRLYAVVSVKEDAAFLLVAYGLSYLATDVPEVDNPRTCRHSSSQTIRDPQSIRTSTTRNDPCVDSLDGARHRGCTTAHFISPRHRYSRENLRVSERPEALPLDSCTVISNMPPPVSAVVRSGACGAQLEQNGTNKIALARR